MNKSNVPSVFIGLILLAGIFGVITFSMDNALVRASISGPISAPTAPSTSPAIISEPIKPSAPVVSPSPISAPVQPSPSVSPSPKPTSVNNIYYWIEYFNNTNLKGKAVFKSFTTNIKYNWWFGSPDKKVKTNNFSARFIGFNYFEGGRYKITTSNDDGMRFYLDGKLVHDAWYNQPAFPRSFEMDIPSGLHKIQVEYYEKSGLASVSFDIKKI